MTIKLRYGIQHFETSPFIKWPIYQPHAASSLRETTKEIATFGVESAILVLQQCTRNDLPTTQCHVHETQAKQDSTTKQECWTGLS